MYSVTISARCFGVKRFMVKMVLNRRFKNISNQVKQVIQCLQIDLIDGASCCNSSEKLTKSVSFL
nr:unnamed protein product [Callosobruchus chinensis]